MTYENNGDDMGGESARANGCAVGVQSIGENLGASLKNSCEMTTTSMPCSLRRFMSTDVVNQ